MHIMEGFLPSPWWRSGSSSPCPSSSSESTVKQACTGETGSPAALAVAGRSSSSSPRSNSLVQRSCSTPRDRLGPSSSVPVSRVLGLIVSSSRRSSSRTAAHHPRANVFSMGIAVRPSPTPSIRSGPVWAQTPTRRSLSPQRSPTSSPTSSPRSSLRLRSGDHRVVGHSRPSRDLRRHPGPARHHRGCDHHAGLQVHRRPQTEILTA